MKMNVLTRSDEGPCDSSHLHSAVFTSHFHTCTLFTGHVTRRHNDVFIYPRYIRVLNIYLI